MARNNYKEYLKKDQVRTKKYFYVLRPILACLWVDKYSTPPPIEFDFLLEAVTISERLKIEIDTLLEKKKNGEELDK
jgi:predicted nucleotidyltransferase